MRLKGPRSRSAGFSYKVHIGFPKCKSLLDLTGKLIWKLPVMGCCGGGCCVLPPWHFLASDLLLTNKMAASPRMVSLWWRPVSEKEEIRSWNSNHVCRPKELLSLSLGPWVTNSGTVLSGHFTGLVLVKPVWWSWWWFYLVSHSHLLGMLSGLESLPGAVEWNVQLTAASKAFSASFLLFPPRPLHGLDLIPGSGFLLDLHSPFWFSVSLILT